MDLQSTFSDLTSDLNPEEIRIKFYEQLKKDLDRGGMSADFVDRTDAAPNALPGILAGELQRNMKRSTFSLPQMLYVIDISENQVKKYMESRQDAEFFDVLSELIIKRVLQKVVTKIRYRA